MKGETKAGGVNHEAMETGSEAPGETLTKTNTPGEILTGIKGQDSIMGNHRGKGDQIPQQANISKVVGIGIRGVEIVHLTKEATNTDEIQIIDRVTICLDRETRIGGIRARWFHQSKSYYRF